MLNNVCLLHMKYIDQYIPELLIFLFAPVYLRKWKRSLDLVEISILSNVSNEHFCFKLYIYILEKFNFRSIFLE